MFSSRLKYLREKKDLSQLELGKILNLTQQTINNYENGKREPNQEILQKIADYFKVSVDYLLGRSDDPKLRQITDPALLKEIEEAKKMMEEASERIYKILEGHAIKRDEGPV